MKLLEGKTALVTGAARGIGRSIALKLAEHGANVAFTDMAVDENALATETQLKSFGIMAKAYASDASSFESCENTVQQIIQDFGTLHIVVNNAGITRDTLLMRMSEDQWDAVIKVNLKSVFNITKATMKELLKNKFGSIINISSVVGVNGNGGQANYSASKAGIIGFTKSVAIELGSRNIRCNAVAPGFIETEMTAKLPEDVKKGWIQNIPLRRVGYPEDVANVCLFLASDLSSYVSGQVIQVCGGMST